MKSPAVTTRAPKDEPYPDFQKRVAADYARAKAKCNALDKYIPRCTYCGETCEPKDSGSTCKENGSPMVSRWAHERANVEWYRIHACRGAWVTEVTNLAILLDTVRAEVKAEPPSSSPQGREGR